MGYELFNFGVNGVNIAVMTLLVAFIYCYI